jgi:hypothetical protein
MPTRWDGDKRGYGVGDAAWLVAGATELVSAFSQSAWVAEEPEIHLGPHVQRWCQLDQRVGLVGSHTDESDAYILELEWRGPPDALGRRGPLSSRSLDPLLKPRPMCASAA